MTQELEIKMVATATLMAIFWQEQLSHALLRELRATRLSLAGVVPRMRHNKSPEAMTHE